MTANTYFTMTKSMSPNRPRHQANISMVSDYESDANYLSDIAPPPAERTNEELNLSVLRRHNRDVYAIEYIAPYAVVYLFSPETQQWEKCGIEGTAFLCALLPNAELSQRYAVMVLNRRGLENFDIELLSSEDVEITDEYIILQSEKNYVPKVYGLWVFSEPPPSSTAHHREAMAQRIQECARKVEDGRRNLEDTEEEIEEIEENIPMGRQISLKELFGQQRQQDDAWSIRSHSPQRPPQAVQPVLQTQHFNTSADTDFFRTPQRHAKPPSPAVSAQSTGPSQQDVLMNLFRKAGEAHRMQS